MSAQEHLEALRLAWRAASERARAEGTDEAIEAAKAAWAAYDAAGTPVRSCWRGYASRAGKRQAAERRALRGRSF